ncbi:hypothetical protein LINGRAHAP2_LOCUS11621 [Linum grandiflorum]
MLLGTHNIAMSEPAMTS